MNDPQVEKIEQDFDIFFEGAYGNISLKAETRESCRTISRAAYLSGRRDQMNEMMAIINTPDHPIDTRQTEQ